MNQTLLTEAHVRVEYIPAHKYIGIWDIDATNDSNFWSRRDCDSILGTIDSMSHVSHPIVTCHTAGWFYENGRKGYFYGFGVPADYQGPIPEGFEIREFPASDYLVSGLSLNFTLWNIESAAIPIQKTITAHAWMHLPFGKVLILGHLR